MIPSFSPSSTFISPTLKKIVEWRADESFAYRELATRALAVSLLASAIFEALQHTAVAILNLPIAIARSAIDAMASPHLEWVAYRLSDAEDLNDVFGHLAHAVACAAEGVIVPISLVRMDQLVPLHMRVGLHHPEPLPASPKGIFARVAKMATSPLGVASLLTLIGVVGYALYRQREAVLPLPENNVNLEEPPVFLDAGSVSTFLSQVNETIGNLSSFTSQALTKQLPEPAATQQEPVPVTPVPPLTPEPLREPAYTNATLKFGAPFYLWPFEAHSETTQKTRVTHSEMPAQSPLKPNELPWEIFGALSVLWAGCLVYGCVSSCATDAKTKAECAQPEATQSSVSSPQSTPANQSTVAPSTGESKHRKGQSAPKRNTHSNSPNASKAKSMSGSKEGSQNSPTPNGFGKVPYETLPPAASLTNSATSGSIPLETPITRATKAEQSGESSPTSTGNYKAKPNDVMKEKPATPTLSKSNNSANSENLTINPQSLTSKASSTTKQIERSSSSANPSGTKASVTNSLEASSTNYPLPPDDSVKPGIISATCTAIINITSPGLTKIGNAILSPLLPFVRRVHFAHSDAAIIPSNTEVKNATPGLKKLKASRPSTPMAGRKPHPLASTPNQWVPPDSADRRNPRDILFGDSSDSVAKVLFPDNFDPPAASSTVNKQTLSNNLSESDSDSEGSSKEMAELVDD